MENTIEEAKRFIDKLKTKGNYCLNYESVAEMLYRYYDHIAKVGSEQELTLEEQIKAGAEIDKQEVDKRIDIFKGYIESSLMLYNLNCSKGLELTMEEVLEHLSHITIKK
jgi:hypothetical protein